MKKGAYKKNTMSKFIRDCYDKKTFVKVAKKKARANNKKACKDWT